MSADDTSGTSGSTEKAPSPAPIETFNKFLVAGGTSPNGQHQLLFLRPLPATLSDQDALLLAAYLVSMVGDDDLWARTLEAVQNA